MRHVITLNRSVQLDQRDESADDNRERGSEHQREHHTRRSQTNGWRSRAERASEEGERRAHAGCRRGRTAFEDDPNVPRRAIARKPHAVVTTTSRARARVVVPRDGTHSTPHSLHRMVRVADGRNWFHRTLAAPALLSPAPCEAGSPCAAFELLRAKPKKNEFEPRRRTRLARRTESLAAHTEWLRGTPKKDEFEDRRRTARRTESRGSTWPSARARRASARAALLFRARPNPRCRVSQCGRAARGRRV